MQHDSLAPCPWSCGFGWCPAEDYVDPWGFAYFTGDCQI